MPTYAVKLGDLDLISEEPITAEQRAEVIKQITKNPAVVGNMVAEGLLRFRSHEASPPPLTQRKRPSGPGTGR